MKRHGMIAWSLAASAIVLPASAGAAGPYYLLRFNQLSTTAPTGFTPFTIPFTFVGQTAYWVLPATDYDEGPGVYTLVYFGSGGTATANIQVDLFGSFQTNCSTIQDSFESFTGTLDDSRINGGTISFTRSAGITQISGLNFCLRITVLSLTGTVVLGYDAYDQRSMIALPSSGYDGGAPDGGGGSGADSGTGPGTDGGGGNGPGQIALDVGCDCSQGPDAWPLAASVIVLVACLRARRAR